MTWSLPKNYMCTINHYLEFDTKLNFSLNKHIQDAVVQMFFQFPPLLYQSVYSCQSWNKNSNFFE